MGLFDFFRKKRKRKNEGSDTSIVDQKRRTSLSIKELAIHDDLKNLIWIGDGNYKNYQPSQENISTIDINGFRIKISFINQEEPSLIYTKQKISKSDNIIEVERPPYFPTYSSLTPRQKWTYLNLLINPYNPSFEIGFVFILYYGLERHLLYGEFERAIDVILKLRDVHSNKSFQSYSANAIVLSCMLHQRADLVKKFIESLDKKHEFAFSDNLFLLCYYSFDLPIQANDIIRIAKSFEFTNMRYIKKYPDLFHDTLTNVIREEVDEDSINLKNYLTPSEFKKLKKKEIRIFANMSISDKSIHIPILSDNFRLKRKMYNLLEITHERVKKKLAEMRKKGTIFPPKKATKKKEVIVFDEKKEIELLADLSNNQRNPVKRHFSYINLQKFYHKYRKVDKKYIDKCIKYCLLDINSLSELNDAYISEKIKTAKKLSSVTGSNNLSNEIEEIKASGFIGNIPAFKRLAIIYEKQGKYSEAIEICNKAIEYGQSKEDFKARKQKLEDKKSS